MKASKSTLADLAKLRAQAAEDAAEPPQKPRKAAAGSRTGRRGSRKRTPAPGAQTPASGVAGPPHAPGATATDAHAPGRPTPASEPVASPELPAEDRALFRRAMQYVRPLAHHGSRARRKVVRDPDSLLRERRAHAQGAAAAHEPAPLRTRRRAPSAPDPDAQEFLQSGCGTDLLRGLRRGKWLPQAILDLHGNTEDQARDRLDRFITTCVEHDIRCVCIVHGKGIGSRHGTPVLKAAVRLHLCRLQAVQAWVQCAEPDGGAGAVTALLRLPPEKTAP